MTVWGSPLFATAGALLADAEIEVIWTTEAEIAAMLAFERALAKAQFEVGEIDKATLHAIEHACDGGGLDEIALAEGIRKDGVVVPALVRQLRARVGEVHASSLHRGATSQDLTDTSLMIRLNRSVAVLRPRLNDVVGPLAELASLKGDRPMMARTRYQDALPFKLGDRIGTWTDPLRDLHAGAPTDFPLQLGGPIGLRAEAYGPDHEQIARAMAKTLGLVEPGRSWHTDRRAIGTVARWCQDVTTALGKIGQDVALMAQTPVREIKAPGGGSSAMAHKNNPVGAELLVTLARYVNAHVAMLQTAALHENERSGIGWTLEWLAVPPVVLACGASFKAATALVSGLDTPEPGPAD